MKALTFEEWKEDIDKQLSKCPCDDCKFRLDYDAPNHIGINNDGEVLYPRVHPVPFVCVQRGKGLDTKKMRNKSCTYKELKAEILDYRTSEYQRKADRQ